MFTIIRDGLKVDPTKYRKTKGRLVGVSEVAITSVKGCIRCRLVLKVVS